MTETTQALSPTPPQPRPTHLRTLTYHGLAPGPRLLVLGAVHGNEVCGAKAIAQLVHDLDSGALRITRGTLTLVPVTNPLAYQLGQRTGDRNLNRNMAPSAIPQDFEDSVANVLCPLLDAHDALLDLHSFHTGGAPFVMIGPQNNTGPLEPFAHADLEMQLALHTGPHRIVEGWLDTYARGIQKRLARSGPEGSRAQALVTNPNYGVGTTEYMRSRGGYGVTLECGQHDDPLAVGVARHAILQTLALLGLTALPLVAEPPHREILRLVDVTDRDHAGDTFSRAWRSFDPVPAGDVIGTRHTGELVKAPTDGFIVFPNPRAEVGQEWFYFAQRRQ
ncbi:MAG: succinylglutamate desuccinylase [Polaromonas sp. 39-63-203]|jgi:predicted deacylase|uniref:succinylglutamate desuccinylase/aspartoacylase domain-containing protein n=1 Tax=Polaromonas sp. TaxID=1869339 RepID=UPI000BD356AA|nr:succinylglutamate desuccinylase/aspartoacylase family protein [Polaromonas sp.]OYY49561.1 MAG: succinylglutamate desuccinylase [Polaromonas sp. 35-63-240]OYZ78323.1 MAG: succinylglutamate desuccinylase [Polaromonas sp. 24-62-144]OZA94988.1 MAG: succinylglutamate desuccinylase [Polaromonas sp. 39-63-203]HQS31451.1 succinylglutamate desuccinylase/aspartoacylase family protein [Polaromonas sp.]HQS90785.1 succinylglutamate desuccinylase/aspartoacylase family protein [Polaromonas sp.]